MSEAGSVSETDPVSEADPDSEADPTSDEEQSEASTSSDEASEGNTPSCSEQKDVHMRKAASGAAVKKDSKWALHLAIAPIGGKDVQFTAGESDKSRGPLLGTQVLYYRASSWFDTIDLMLQAEGMRADRLKRNEGIIVGEASPAGGSKETAISLEEDPPAATPAVPAGTRHGGPVRNSKHLIVSFHEGGRDSLVSHIFPVSKTHSMSTYKSSVKDVLAEEDFFGEEIWTTRLKWTYMDGDGRELDISPSTEAADLEASAALHVYTLPKRS